jgi:Flp pilus assembly protein TadD
MEGVHQVELLPEYLSDWSPSLWRFRHFLGSLPVLLVATVVAALALANWQRSARGLRERYVQEADRALQAQDDARARTYYRKAFTLGGNSRDHMRAIYQREGERRLTAASDFAGARLCFERVLALDAASPAALLGLALCLDGTGRVGDAAAIMTRLAPADRSGYFPAHLWQAQRLLQAAEPTAADQRLAELHLQLALKLHPGEAGAHALLAQLYWNSARYDEAEPHLVNAAPAAPALYLRLAELHAARKEWGQAAKEADLAVPFFSDRCRFAPQDVPARVFWAEAEMLAGRHADAVHILRAELGSADQPVYLQTLGRVYASWAAAVERDAKADPAKRLQLIEEGLKYDAGNSELLSALTPERTRPGEAAQTRALLLRLISDGRAPAAANLILGMDAWQRRDFAAARVHWETALRLAPQLNLAANNLAWLLANEKPRDLTRALALIDAALERAPHEPRFRGTRGYILARLGRWREALPELIAALPAYRASASHHRLLNETYKKLGLSELALEHQNRAEMLAKKEAGR